MLLLGDWAPRQEQTAVHINTHEEFVLLNLEGPVITTPSNYVPIRKAGPHLYSLTLPNFENPSAVFFSLANNHIMDYGWHAVQATIEQLRSHAYNWAGVGENEYLAQRPLLFTINECRYAIFSFFEIQAGRATSTKPGSASIGSWIYDAIAQVRHQVDKLILSVHAGNEMLPWPSPSLQDLYRSYIDAGADIVHGHHAHVPQGVENYKGGLICYGLGNFLCSPARFRHIETRLSLGVRVRYEGNQLFFQIEPYCFAGDRDRVIVSDANSSKQIDTYLELIQSPLEDRELLEEIWQEAALWLYDKYGRDNMALPFTTEERYLGNLKKYIRSLGKQFYPRVAFERRRKHQNQMIWYHMFSCFSHRNMMATALGVLCGEIPDIRSSRSQKFMSEFLQRLYVS